MKMDSKKILVVDDERGIRDFLSYELALHGYTVATASNGGEALENIENGKFQVVISDVKMPGIGGIELLEKIKKIAPETEVIMSTGFGTVEMAVEAMKKGAYDFVQKPFNVDEILALIEKALEKSGLRALVALYESSQAVFSSVCLEETLDVVVGVASRVLRADDASILMPGKDGRLAMVASVGLKADGIYARGRLTMAERVIGGAAETRQLLVLSGPLEIDTRFSDVSGLGDIRSTIVFPLTLGGTVLGVLNVNRTTTLEPFEGQDLMHATIYGSQIAQALHNALLYRELEEKIRKIQEMQFQLVQSEKLAAVGQLAAGIAHEVNNPLTGILGFAEFLSQADNLSREQKEDVEAIIAESKRCRDIVQNLLKFSRPSLPQLNLVDVSRALDVVLKLVQYDFRHAHIEIRKLVSERAPWVLGDVSQLEQVFLNIVTNARHAMEGREGGVLEIHAVAAGERVFIRFRDTGSGIPPEKLGRIFDPFFTTKPVGKGTGLGLSISHGIIQRHKGTIRVESQVGVGTTFILDLPASAVPCSPMNHEVVQEVL